AKSLACLATLQPELAQRLHWPADGEHLFRDDHGQWTLCHRGTNFPATLCAEEIATACEEIDPAFDGTLLLFGVGLGELLSALLERAPGAHIVAWERDPWMLRQALSLWDWTHALESDRLRFAMHAELGPLVHDGLDGPRVLHPLLARVYTNERVLVQDGIQSRRAFVCTGTLFVDSLADALREQGYSVMSLDVECLAEEEIDLALQCWQPELVAGINSVHGLAEFCEERGVNYMCWEIDPAMDEPRALAFPSSRAHLYTYRQENIQAFRNAGYSQVEYLPLAADPNRRQPQVLDEGQLERYGARVSFVGASLMRNVQAFTESFLEQCAVWQAGSPERVRHVMRDLVIAQQQDFSVYSLPDLLDKALPGFRAHSQSMGWSDPVLFLAEISAAEKRLNYMACLREHGPVVWGDEGWSQLEAHGVRFNGPALHDTELPLIYSGSTINVDIGRLYQNGIVTMRIFDILACGGFVLAEHSAALAELFDLGVEIESYRSVQELQEKVQHYLAHPEQAREIAQRGYHAVLARHTIRCRVQHMLAGFGEAERTAVA
ncbi:MAG: spore maturation protein CgeB, partial [Candidatus Paceibacteria bacterium]